MMRKHLFLGVMLLLMVTNSLAQRATAETPPMGFMTWNYFAENISESQLKEVVDAMVSTGLRDAGYNFIFIDDGWQGGRDAKNNLIPDPKKFPSGMKAFADYVHSKGMKLGIYSNAAELTCAGYTGSYGFEEKDAKTFARWGIDYLKYDYCHAPSDWKVAIERYEKMAIALQNSGREITFAICEWGDREPWLWGKKAGGQLWRTTADVRDKWKSIEPYKNAKELHRVGAGILDIVNRNAELSSYAGINGWNDADMLVIGLYGKKGPSGDLGGVGCTDTEYRSQMSLWCLMAAPLMITCDVRNMNETTHKILMNHDVIKINQDKLGKQATRIVNSNDWQIFLKPLQNGDIAIGILNTADNKRSFNLKLDELGITGKTTAKDLWTKKASAIKNNQMKITADSHETILLRLSK
ncbi:glycoside hydrolase family 27 protein [Capnocytophaga cynodegmi]|uniref:glycoside hydrolase family 27 protein n=1 Tax=Capnocytophaga cynodegmi TaxID=28189 RepID=UPI00385A994E